MARLTPDQMAVQFAEKFEKFSQDASRVFGRLGWTWQTETVTPERIESTCWHCLRELLRKPDRPYHQCGTGGIMLDYVNWPRLDGSVSTECRLYIQIYPGVHANPLPPALDTAHKKGHPK